MHRQSLPRKNMQINAIQITWRDLSQLFSVCFDNPSLQQILPQHSKYPQTSAFRPSRRPDQDPDSLDIIISTSMIRTAFHMYSMRPKVLRTGIRTRTCQMIPRRNRNSPFTTSTNHAVPQQESFEKELNYIVGKFPPVAHAFAYGSGVFPQSAKTSTGPSMIDFILGVPCAEEWHGLNLQQNPHHYGALGKLGKRAIARVQELGAGVYFNPFVTINGVLIKYGVVSMDTLCQDLTTWDTLYVAGRLQKPTRTLCDDPLVQKANQVNLSSAIKLALLLLPETFAEQDLYATIAGISYLGDPRMSVGGDDPRKVQNMIEHQLDDFRRLYSTLLGGLNNVSSVGSPGRLQQCMDPSVRGSIIRSLPSAFRGKLYFGYRKRYSTALDAHSSSSRGRKSLPRCTLDFNIAGDTGLRQQVEQAIRKTVRWPSFTQSIKSAVTAGIARSWRYAREKRRKAVLGTR
ncbi:Mmp37-domain-containing protein [Aspergillus welwitschiae]|uniref:Phosphatidate cytidylyltransferase, mitochondrial n=1 Tax=Aspergillus welwitschiae TaxID=1341132 RepID=A0A3F3PSI9_9EURO|nr:Mmp37-domain-containing protein [Aspergillus welwitschiae]RDH29897.1 Mmp37-domain-containing protein [Aspergillus welwitschiae]